MLQSIVEQAIHLARGDSAGIFRVVGDQIERVANFNRGAGQPAPGTRLSLDRGSMSGRAILERRTIHHHDLQAVVEQRSSSS